MVAYIERAPFGCRSDAEARRPPLSLLFFAGVWPAGSCTCGLSVRIDDSHDTCETTRQSLAETAAPLAAPCLQNKVSKRMPKTRLSPHPMAPAPAPPSSPRVLAARRNTQGRQHARAREEPHSLTKAESYRSYARSVAKSSLPEPTLHLARAGRSLPPMPGELRHHRRADEGREFRKEHVELRELLRRHGLQRHLRHRG